MKTTLLSITCALLLVGCEQTVDVELPYDKLIVVNSFVGRLPSDYAWISRTLPVNEELTVAKSFISNAAVQIHWRDTTYNLLPDLTAHGYILPQPDERWQGDSLRMTVDWDGLHTEATARVPKKPESIRLLWRQYSNEPSYGVLIAEIVFESGVVAWVDATDRGYGYVSSPMQFYSEYKPYPNVGNREVVMVQLYVGELSKSEAEATDSIFVNAWLADIDYDRYLVQPYTRRNEPFGFGGSNPYFNVKGKGLGLFVPVTAISQYVTIEFN